MIGKLLLTLAAVALLWFAFRYVSQRAELKGRENERRDLLSMLRRGKPARPADPVDETQQCRVCGAYVVVGRAASCGRADCPV
jgi:hypothetical protein